MAKEKKRHQALLPSSRSFWLEWRN